MLLATNVLSLCAGLVMNMREERAIRLVLSVKLDTSASKVRMFFILLSAYLLNSHKF